MQELLTRVWDMLIGRGHGPHHPIYDCIARTQWRPQPMHDVQVAAATNILFDSSKIVSRDLHRQADFQPG